MMGPHGLLTAGHTVFLAQVSDAVWGYHLAIAGGVLLYLAQFAGMLWLLRTRSARRNGWTVWHVVGLQVMAALGVMLTWEAWADILNIASKDEESSHIFLVPIIFAWLIWVRRERLRFCAPGGGMVGPVLVLVGWVLNSFGYNPSGSIFSPIVRPIMWVALMGMHWVVKIVSLGYFSPDFLSYLDKSVQSLWHGGAVLVVVGCVLSFAGREVLARFLPAFAVLVFLVPMPVSLRQWIAIPLQGALAMLTQQILDLMNIVVVRTGNLLEINGVPVAIAEACNGLRMVFALVLVSYAFAFGTPLRAYVRWTIILASPIVALLCNIVRMIPTVWLYGFSDQMLWGLHGKEVANTFHDVAGWVMLVVAFLMLMGIIRVLRWAMVPVTRYTLAYD